MGLEMYPMVLKKLIQEQDSNYHIRKILEIIREEAHAIWKERTRVHTLVYKVRRYKSKARKKNKI